MATQYYPSQRTLLPLRFNSPFYLCGYITSVANH
jgi:hypothetical protein